MLANIDSEKAFSLPNAATNNSLHLEFRAMAQPQQSSSITLQEWIASLFSGAVIQGEQFSVTIKTLN